MIDHIALLAEVQAHILRVRQIAASTKDPRTRDACLRVANAIEQRARELDQMSLALDSQAARRNQSPSNAD